MRSGWLRSRLIPPYTCLEATDRWVLEVLERALNGEAAIAHEARRRGASRLLAGRLASIAPRNMSRRMTDWE
eukprot:644619-Amorphochlora_amoeboformis.AAC.1